MYKIYQTSYKPFWINSENKPSSIYFEKIDFLWNEVNDISVNYINEESVSLTVNNLDTIYYKIEELNADNSIKNTTYFYFNSVLRRLTTGYIISCKIDYWTTFNMKVEKSFIDNNSIVKFRRAHLKLNDFKQYPVFVDSLLNSVNDWKSKNTPFINEWNEQLLKSNGKWIKYNKDINRIATTNNIVNGKLIADFSKFYKKNYVFNKYFVVDYEGEYLLFPDFSETIETPQDNLAEANKPGVNESYSAYIENNSNTYHYFYSSEKTNLNLMRIKGYETTQYNQEWTFCKLNTKSDMNYLINHSIFAAKKNTGFYFGPDIAMLLDITKFNLEWGIWSEYYQKDNKDYSINLFFIKLPFIGARAFNLFETNNQNVNTIVNNLNTPSYLTNGERDIIVGNTIIKYKQLINNNYLLRFDNSGFKLFPINQTNIDLFRVIEYGDLLPTNKDLYLEYVSSVRNSVNTGYWTNYAQKQFQIGQKAVGGLFNAITNQNAGSAISTIFNTVSNAVNLEFNNSLLIANTKAKFADMKNSIGITPQTYNIQNQNFYLIPQNWLDNNLNNLKNGYVVNYQYSIMDWLEPTIIDINNLFLFYGFELNNSYPFYKVFNQENFYFTQIDSEYLTRNINSLYPLNIDYQLKINAMNEWTAGVRIFKKEPNEVNTSWTI